MNQTTVKIRMLNLLIKHHKKQQLCLVSVLQQSADGQVFREKNKTTSCDVADIHGDIWQHMAKAKHADGRIF